MRHCIVTSPVGAWCRAHPRPPRCSGQSVPGCPCRDPLGCHRCPGRTASGAERQPLRLCCAGGGGHVMWTLLIHAFYKHTSSRSLMRASSTALRHVRELELLVVVACPAIVQVVCCLTHRSSSIVSMRSVFHLRFSRPRNSRPCTPS